MSGFTRLSSGRGSGNFATMLQITAGNYTSSAEALLEYVQNATDAEGGYGVQIRLSRRDNSITIIDYASGMGGNMPTEDRQIMELYWEYISQSMDPGCDLRTIVNREAMQTLEWFINNIAHSVKGNLKFTEGHQMDSKLAALVKQKGRRVQKYKRSSTLGKYGIGAWSYLAFANRIQITTRPNEELAAALGIPLDAIPAFVLFLPSREEVGIYKLDYELYQIDPSEFVDTNGNPIAHGTRIDIKEIDPTAWEDLTVEKQVRYYRGYFGGLIESTGLQIEVSDDTKSMVVPPQLTRGMVILDETFPNSDGVLQRIFLYYDGDARDLRVRVEKNHVKICDLTDLRRFGLTIERPWDSGRLGGFITFEYEEDDRLFDPGKHGILDTPQRKFWWKQVKRFEGTINQAIEQLENRAKDEKFARTAYLLQNALSAALEDQRIIFSGPTSEEPEAKKTRGPDKKKQRTPRELRHVIVTVVDRNGRGVEGVPIRITSREYTWDRESGVSGTVQFPMPMDGQHMASIPEPWKVVGERNVKFKIDRDRNIHGLRLRFVIDQGDNTGTVSPQIQVVFNVWEDPGEPWRQSIHSALPTIEFNINQYTVLRQYLDWESTTQADTLIAQYTTAAVMEAQGNSGDHESRIRESVLFAAIIGNLIEGRGEAKPKKKTKE